MYEDLTPVTRSAFQARRDKGEKDFSKCYFSEMALTGDFRGFDFSGARFMSCVFQLADISGANFTGATINADFLTATAVEADFENACIYMGLVKDSDFHHANFSSATLRRMRFHRADLSHADFSSAKLDGAMFKDLTGAAGVIGTDTMRTTMGGATAAEVENNRHQIFEALQLKCETTQAAKAVSDRMTAAQREADARTAHRQQIGREQGHGDER